MNPDNLNNLKGRIRSGLGKARTAAEKYKKQLLSTFEKTKDSFGKMDILNKSKNIYAKGKDSLENFLKSENKVSSLYANKKLFYAIACSAGIIILAGSVYFSTLSYEVYIEDKLVGIASSKAEVEHLIEDIKSRVPSEYGHDVSIGQKISMNPVHVSKGQLTEIQELEKRINSEVDLEVEAYGINVDGEVLTALKSKEEAESILEKIREPYEVQEEGVSSKEIDFLQDVKIEKIETKISDIKTTESALTYLVQGTDKLQIYKVKEGDSAWAIARALDIHVADIEKANPDVDVEKLQIGQEISVTVPKPYISVKTVEDVTYEEKIPYEVVYEDTSAMYKGDKKVKKEGHEGIKKIQAKLVKVDGIVSNTEVIEEEIIKDPVSKVVVKGTKARPKTLAFGSFINPTRGRLSSPFGRRWGRMHTGIDIANSTGTPIKAADGGKVTYAGWKSGYGKLVIINHENGYQTYYAHCSSINVSKGSRVYRGQKIAEVGSTGRSTGPHLHFEVRKNGVPQNPSRYVGY